MRKRFIAVLLAVGLVGAAASTRADDLHYTNLLVGDRASGMGGAYTAVSDDATGLYYNPAGIVFASGRNVTASVNAYFDNEKVYKSVIGGNGWSRRSNALLPNYFGVIQPLGRFKVGFSYAVPDSIQEDQSQTFHNLPLNTSIQPYNPGVSISSYIINFNDQNTVYNVGPSIAMEISDNLSVGATFYYYQKQELWILNQLIKTTNGGYEWTNNYYHSEEKGARPVLGLMWTPMDNVSVGLTLSKVLLWESDTTSQYTYRRENINVDANPADGNVASLPDGQISLSTRRTMPKQISLGIAIFPSPSFLVSADVRYYSAKSIDDIVSFRGDTANGIKDVLNYAVGTEYYLSRQWALRGGLYTDFANTPQIVSGGTNQKEHVDIYGGTLSTSYFTRNTAVTLGGSLALGSGQAQIIGNSTSIQDVATTGWLLFLSSSYSY